MASRNGTVRVDLGTGLVARTRAALGAQTESDAAVVEHALNAYLLHRVVDAAQTRAALSEAASERLAYQETHAARRESEERLS